MTALFTDFFRQQLFTTPTLMNGAVVRVVYYTHSAAISGGAYDPKYTGLRTITDLSGVLGWSGAQAPSDPETLGTLTPSPGNSTYVLANNPFENPSGWAAVEVSAAAFILGTPGQSIGGVVNPIIFITDDPFVGSTVMRPTDSLLATQNTALGGNNHPLFAWQVPAAGATQVLPTSGALSVLKAPPAYEFSHQQHAWLFPQRVNLLANPSFELGTNHWKSNGTLARVARPLSEAGAWEGRVNGSGSAMKKGPFWLKTGQTANTTAQFMDEPFTVKAKLNITALNVTGDIARHGVVTPNFAWRLYLQGGEVRLALSYNGTTEDTSGPAVFTAAEFDAIANPNQDVYVGVEVYSLAGNVAYRGITSSDGLAWSHATPQKGFNVGASSVHVSTGMYAVGGANWTGKLYWVSLEARQPLWRFDAGNGYLKSFWHGLQDEEWTALDTAIDGTAGVTLILESNPFPTNPVSRSGLWTVQLMIRGTGRVRIGLMSWESDFASTGVDWGPDTDVWTLPADGYLHIYALRRVGDGSTGVVRIECDGVPMYVDQLLVEPEWLDGWPYFDGDTTYGALDDFSWYGGEGRKGQTYSLWYNHRRAVIGRLFAWSIPDSDFTVTDEEVEGQGFVYKWVPAGVRVIPHMDVLWVGDVQSPVPAVSGTVTPLKTSSTDALGVYPAWALATP